MKYTQPISAMPSRQHSTDRWTLARTRLRVLAQNIALVVCFLLMYGVVGTLDLEDAKNEELAYCDRLADGTHTDYNNLKSTCDALREDK